MRIGAQLTRARSAGQILRNGGAGQEASSVIINAVEAPPTLPISAAANCRGVVTMNAASGIVTRNVEYFALAHASRFVRPGAVRVGSSTGVQGIASVAFRNAADGSKALLVLNTNASAQRFVVRAGGARSFGYTLPASSVATFVWR